ncbi:hypothetical protein D3C84_1178090 [compost metagenome]
MTRPVMTQANALQTLFAAAMPLRIVYVHNVPSTPKAIRIGRRPVRSDSAPTSGCSSMNTSSDAADTSVASALLKPPVLTRNFCG